MRATNVLDGQQLTLGDTTWTLVRLPGHTPTSVSGIVPAKHQGRTRYMDVELESGRARVAANRDALNKARGPEYYRTPDGPAGAANGRGGQGGTR